MVADPLPILIIGANDRERDWLATCVADLGYAVVLDTPEQIAAAVCTPAPAAVVIDVSRCRPDAATTLVRRARAATSGPILTVVASEDITTGTATLDAGADDFLRRPIARQELQARLRAHLRPRPRFQSASHAIRREVP